MTVIGHLEQHPGLNPPPFQATIESIGEDWVILDKSYFYPIGGGQPSDKGQITSNSFSCDIVDVRNRETYIHSFQNIRGTVNVGDIVNCEVDAIWRNQMCKMHTAQHIISALASEEWGAQTVGNQIGYDRTRIDLLFENRELFDKDHLESYINDEIQKGHTVSMDFRSTEDLLSDPLVRIDLSRMPKHIETFRTISIGQIDVCPCAGTHVEDTSQIPDIEITKVKSKGSGKLRIEYVMK